MQTRGAVAPSLVRAVRAHGHRPAAPGPGAPTWATVADGARTLALGLAEVGVGAGRVVEVDPAGLAPHQVVERELAVLAAGAVLALPGVGAADDGPRAVLAGDEVVVRGTSPVRAALADVRARGAEADAAAPDRHEEALDALDPSAPALVLPGRVASAGEVAWALRAVHRWLAPAVGSPPPASVLLVPPAAPDRAVPAALVGRWWPASVGAALVDPASGAGAEVVVADPGHWADVAAAVRAGAGRSGRGRALLRRGRLVAAGEDATPVERARLAAARRRLAPAVRAAAGVGTLRLGVCWGAPAPVDGRDLAAAEVPVVATWAAPEAVAPVASGPVGRPDPAGRWGRPLPGRDVAVDGAGATATGGDLPGGDGPVAGPVAVDDRGRVRVGR